MLVSKEIDMTVKKKSNPRVPFSGEIDLENLEWILAVMNKEQRNGKSDALRLILRRDKERESK